MKLTKVIVENFRCYQAPFEMTIDDFTAVIGRNDIGKSAILDALAIFFERDKMDQNDASMGGDRESVKITCEFDDLPEYLDIDAGNKTTLQSEYLLNNNDRLEITKEYNGTLASPKATKIHARALHPNGKGYSDLLSLKNADLKRRATDLGIDLSNCNKTVNAEIRQAIWNSRKDTRLSDTLVDLQKETGKQVWSSLQQYLPTYWLFKSDRASTDQDSEAQDPLKAAISEAVKAVEGELSSITARVEKEVKKIAALTLAKLAEMDPELSGSLDPVISTKKWETNFNTSITGDNGIPLNKRGSGVRRLILLSFFRAQVEASIENKTNASVIYAIEEPETSQHPKNQRLLLSTLQQLTSDPSRQVIITTHTPMLARAIPDTKLRFIHTEGPNRALAVGGGNLNRDIAKSLGVLPDHNVKLFIAVEGPHDISFLSEMSKVLNNSDPNLPNLPMLELDGKLIFVPMGGSCLAMWADRLSEIGRPEIHICDRDNEPPTQPKYEGHIEEINARDGCVAFCTEKREMENYIHPDAIKEAYEKNGMTIELPDSFNDFDDVPKIVAQAVHNSSCGNEWEELDAKKQKDKSSRAKKVINGAAAKNMTVERLNEVDPNGEVIRWMNEIQSKVTMDQ